MTDGRAGGPKGGLPGPRRGRAVDADLRGQAVAAVVRHGMGVRAAARHFGLGEKSVQRWVKQFREHGHVRSGKQGGSRLRIEPERERIFRILAAQPKLSIYGLRDALAAEGLAFSAATVQRFLKRHRLERKRRLARRRCKQGNGPGAASDANPATPAGSIPSRSRHRGAGVRRDSP